jgi:hypothetical protein
MAPGLTLPENNTSPQEMIISSGDLIPMALPNFLAHKKEAGEKTSGSLIQIDNHKPVAFDNTATANKTDDKLIQAMESNGTEDLTAKIGMECDIKNLYQKEDERGRCTWTDKYPDDLDEAAENEATARYAVLVRNKKSYDSRKKLEIDSIVIQSPLLKNALSLVLKNYPGKALSRNFHFLEHTDT